MNTKESFDQPGLADAVATNQGHALRASNQTTEPRATQSGQLAPRRQLRIGQVNLDVLVSAQPTGGLIELRLGLQYLITELSAHLARSVLRASAPLVRGRPDELRVGDVFASSPSAARQPRLGLNPLALLYPKSLPRAGHSLLGGALLAFLVLNEGVVAAAKTAQHPGVELSYLINDIEQVEVVADHDEGAGPVGYQRQQCRFRFSVQIIGWFIEQGHRMPCQPQPENRSDSRLAPGKLPDAAIQLH